MYTAYVSFRIFPLACNSAALRGSKQLVLLSEADEAGCSSHRPPVVFTGLMQLSTLKYMLLQLPSKLLQTLHFV